MSAIEKAEANPAAPDPSAQLAATVESLRSGSDFKNYLRARDAVLRCLGEMDRTGAEPSSYWRAELGGFSYLLDASPLIVEKLREHCHHVTGDASYRYRDHHAILAEQFEKKLGRLGKMDRSELFVPESTILGGFGHLIDGQLINIDTLKFYECLIAIDRAGFLDQLKSDPARKEVWLEIGAGWGGFGNAVKTRFPDTTYVIVDLPQTILFSATYLLSAFPAAKMAIYPEVSAAEISRNLRDYDFVFIPHFLFPDISFDLDLALNMVSFQEMTTEQVTNYVRRLAEIGCRRLFSLNRDRSSYNSELSAVTDLIDQNFAPTRRIEMLPYSYASVTQPKIPRPQPTLRNLLAQRLFGAKPPPIPKTMPRAEHAGDYRHLVAERDA